MGMIESPVKKISQQRFLHVANMASRCVTKLVNIDSRFYALGKNGNIYTNARVGAKHHREYPSWGGNAAQALFDLGVINVQELDAHMDRVKSLRKRSDLDRAEHEINRAAKTLGICFTKGQLKTMRGKA